MDESAVFGLSITRSPFSFGRVFTITKLKLDITNKNIKKTCIIFFILAPPMIWYFHHLGALPILKQVKLTLIKINEKINL
jgi:hypothetical protein